MRVSTKGRYAIRVIIDMAENGESEFHPLHNLAERQGLSEKYLEAILGVLVKNNVLEGARGKGGGYKLAKPAAELTVWEILSVIETSISPVRPCRRLPDTPDVEGLGQNHQGLLHGYYDRAIGPQSPQNCAPALQ